MKPRIRVQFLGGVAYNDNITGSSFLFTIEQKKRTFRILFENGLVQCYKDFLERNRAILRWLDPSAIDAVVLSHAHIDHSGRLPFLVKNGFRGRIFCTEATSLLLPVMLGDSAKVQMTDALHMRTKNKKKDEVTKDFGRDKLTRGKYDRAMNKRHHKPKFDPYQPLYGMEDVSPTCALVKNDGFPYFEWIRLEKDISLKFYPSGHVLGGAICVIKIADPEGDIHLGFSGDLGRFDGIILPPPALIEEPIDYLWMESTYGGREHPVREGEIQKLMDLIKVAVAKKQKILIPSFALERAQELVYLLSYYMSTRQIPKIPIFLDSPMASKITDVFAKSWELKMFQGQDKLNFNPFDTRVRSYLKTIQGETDSQALTTQAGPYIVIAASGMCDAGRIRTHLRAGLESPKTVVALVGYMAENSLGRKLKDGLKIVRMNGDELMVRAQIVSFDSFSAHADGPALVSYTASVMSKNDNPKHKIFLVHGEEKGATALKLDLLHSLPADHWRENIIIPKLGEEIML